jgi:hypothetical protein
LLVGPEGEVGEGSSGVAVGADNVVGRRGVAHDVGTDSGTGGAGEAGDVSAKHDRRVGDPAGGEITEVPVVGVQDARLEWAIKRDIPRTGTSVDTGGDRLRPREAR